MADQVKFEWVLPVSAAEAEYQGLQSAGVQVAGPPQAYQPEEDEIDEMAHAAFEPMMMLVGAAAAAFLAERIVHAVKNYQFGGAVVDLRGDTVRITPNRAFDAGTVVIVRPDGEVETFTSETKPINIVETIKSLLGG